MQAQCFHVITYVSAPYILPIFINPTVSINTSHRLFLWIPSMATHDRHPHQVQVHTIGQHNRYDPTGHHDKSVFPQNGPSKGKVLAVMALLPVGGGLLGLAGITLVGTMIGLAVATPLFILFSPIIVPAVLTIGLAVTGFLTCGTFGLTGLSSLSFLVNSLRQATGSVPELVEYAGQKTKEVGQSIQEKAHEIGPEGQVHGGVKEGRGTRMGHA